jgi:hypothetical protein
MDDAVAGDWHESERFERGASWQTIGGSRCAPEIASSRATAEPNGLLPGCSRTRICLQLGRSQTYTPSSLITVRWRNQAMNLSRRAVPTC